MIFFLIIFYDNSFDIINFIGIFTGIETDATILEIGTILETGNGTILETGNGTILETGMVLF